jgi:hypothetical protein
MLSSPNACLIIARVSIWLFPRYAQNLIHACCRIHCKITSGDIQIKGHKNQHIHPAAYTNSQDMLVLSYTVALCYYNYCTDGSSPEYYGYTPVWAKTFTTLWKLFFFFLLDSKAILLGLGLLAQGDQPIARPLPTHRTTQTHNKRTQTSMPPVGFEPTTSVLKWAKKFMP